MATEENKKEEEQKVEDSTTREKVIEKINETYDNKDGGRIILIGNLVENKDGGKGCESIVNIDRCSNGDLAQFVNNVIYSCDGLDNSLLTLWEKELQTGLMKNRKAMVTIWLLKKLFKNAN